MLSHTSAQTHTNTHTLKHTTRYAHTDTHYKQFYWLKVNPDPRGEQTTCFLIPHTHKHKHAALKWPPGPMLWSSAASEPVASPWWETGGSSRGQRSGVIRGWWQQGNEGWMRSETWGQRSENWRVWIKSNCTSVKFSPDSFYNSLNQVQFFFLILIQFCSSLNLIPTRSWPD